MISSNSTMRVNVHMHNVRRYVQNSPTVNAAIAKMAETLLTEAREEYLRANKGHSTHTPPYEDQFFVKDEGDNEYTVGNRSLVAKMVEYGTHAGGSMPALGYAPVRRGGDAVVAKWRIRKVVV